MRFLILLPCAIVTAPSAAAKPTGATGERTEIHSEPFFVRHLAAAPDRALRPGEGR